MSLNAGSVLIPSGTSASLVDTVVVGIQSVPLLLVCATCQCGSPSVRALKDHLRKVHNLSGVETTKAVENLSGNLSSLISSVSQLPISATYYQAPYHHNDAGAFTSSIPLRLDPLAGIAVKQGYQCPICPCCHAFVRSLKNHFLQDHSLSTEDADSRLRSVIAEGSIDLQTLYSGKKTCFFPVTSNDKTGQIICPITLNVGGETESPLNIQSNPSASIPSPPCVQTSQDTPAQTFTNSPYRQAILCTFQTLMKPSQTDQSSEKVACSRKNTFIQTTQFDKVLEDSGISLQNAVILAASGETSPSPRIHSLKSAIESYLSATSAHLRTMHPSFVHRINLRSNEGPFRVVSAATLKRYAAQATRFLLYLARTNPSSNCASLATLHAAISDVQQSHTSEFSLETIHFILRSELLTVFEEFHPVDSLTVRNFLASASVIPHSSTAMSGSSVTQQPVSYRFADASEMTHTLAALQYVCSACAVHEMLNIRKMAETTADSRQTHLEMNAHVDRLFNSLKMEKNTPAAFIRKTLDLCMGLSSMEEIDLSFDNCHVHSFCGVVNNAHVGLPAIGKAIRACTDSFQNTLHQELLLGQDLPNGFMTIAQSLMDNASSRKPGLSFLSYNATQIGWLQKNMLYVLEGLRAPRDEYLSKTPCVFPDTLREDYDSPQIVTVASHRMWSNKVLLFLSHCQKIQEDLLFMMHVSSGSPARATEIATYRLHNDHYAMRNIILSQQQVTLIARYAKQRNIRGGARPILRFPDEETSKCIIVYLALMRPLECEMVRALYGNEAMQEHWYWMFADKGVPFSAKRIRNIVSSKLEEAGMPISFADYRHFTSGMVPSVCGSKLKAIISDVMDEFSITGHEQASHSSQTAQQVYARTTHQVSMVSASEMARNKEWCNEWHRLLHSGAPELQDALCHKSKVSSHKHATTVLPVNEVSLPGCLNSKRRKLDPSQLDLPRSQDGIPTKTLTTRPDDAISKLYRACPRSFEGSLPLLLAALRNATGDQKAVFKSHTQFTVTASILSEPGDKLVLMPTGSGKTMCILLPASIERSENLSTIIIVPLLALQKEYEKRANLFNLSVSTRPSQPGSKDFSDVYIFTPEFIQKKEFSEFVSRLSATKTLARIVIDEAHLTFLWGSFRDALKNIRLALALIPKDIPRILLSATVPPEDRAALIACHGLSQTTLHSMPTSRRNLKFTVEYLRQDDGQSRHRGSSGIFSAPEQFLTQMTVMNIQEQIRRLASRPNFRNGNFCRVIVYAFSRSMCSALFQASKAINSMPENTGTESFHVEVLMYHAGLSEQERDKMHEDWSDNERLDDSPETSACFRIMICTSAFGTGVDCPNIRLSFHIGGANGLVDFIQETGRSGRDGLPSSCIMLYCPTYASSIEETIRRRNDDIEVQEALRRWLQLEQWVLNKEKCRKNWLYEFVDGKGPGVCLFDPQTVNCDICEKRHGSPISSLQSLSQSIQGTPDTIRPWNSSTSSLSSLALSIPPRHPSSIGTFTDSHHHRATPPARLSAFRMLPSQPSRSLSREIASCPSVPNSFQPNFSQDIPLPQIQGFNPRSSMSLSPFNHPRIPRTQGLNNRASISMPPSLQNHSASLPTRQFALPQISSAPTLQAGAGASDSQATLEMTHNLARLGAELCFPCLVHKSQHLRHNASNCPWLLNRCFRCFTNTHRISSCTVPRPPQGFCYKCGLRNLLDQKLHTSDFSYGTSCRIFPLVTLCWSLWRSPAFQKTIAQEFFSDPLLQEYNSLVTTPNAIMSQLSLQAQLDNLFAQALSDGFQPIPTTIRIALSYASTTELL